MVRYIDISVPTSAATTVYPGDEPPAFYWPGWTHENGDPANVGFYKGGLHHGTHVDAPWHFIRGARRLDEVPLDHWLGPCEVLDLRHLDRCVDAAALEGANIPPGAKRLLFRTKNGESDYWNEPWNPDFIFIDESAARWCTERGVLTVGLDYLTVDPPWASGFPAHMELLGKGTLIIENLRLRGVAAGTYELLAAPVNLVGVDGGWCRAILRAEA
jgi:arylformamidase